MVDPDGKQPPMADEGREDSMQRVRVGLTGLAVVLVLLAVATAIFRTVDSQMPDNAAVVAEGNEAEPDEPLADLGMAPKAPGENSVAAENSKK